MENTEMKAEIQPNISETQEVAEEKATTPEASPNENSFVTVPIKFNKETKNLTISEAAALAQKGMKYDLIKTDIERLRKMADSSGKNISDYLSELEQARGNSRRQELLERCGGDEKLVDEILSLEGKKAGEKTLGLDELIREVDEINSADDIPQAVIEAAEEKGGNLFDEYLRYKFIQNRKAQNALLSRKNAENASVGSQSSGGLTENAASAEFLRGIWN